MGLLNEAKTGRLLQEISRSFPLFDFSIILFFLLGHAIAPVYLRLYANLRMRNGMSVI